MTGVCQALCAILALTPVAGAVAAASPTPEARVSRAVISISVTVQPWRSRPLGEVLFDNPELAACLSLRPGTVETLAAPAAGFDYAELKRAVSRQFDGLPSAGGIEPLVVVVASQGTRDPSAIAHGGTVLLIVPREEPATPVALAGSIASAVLFSRMRPAAPDARTGEPLLVLAEGLVRAGWLRLATLPPDLRPVGDWIEAKDARAALATLADAALDRDVAWSRRRARLIRLGEPDGAEPALAHAAALLVESCQRPADLAARPFDLLLVWQHSDDKRLPSLPGVLKRALDHPVEAGLPKEKEAAEREFIANEALERRIASGETVVADSTWPLHRRLQAAALARARGATGVCGLLDVDSLPAGVRTGCRDGEGAGVVVARPLVDSSTEIAWMTGQDQAVPLLLWPRLALWPAIVGKTDDLFFIDAIGVWRVALGGAAAPVRVATGEFRALAVAPGGASFAALRAADGRIVVGNAGRLREVEGEESHGMAWVTGDVLALATAHGIRLIGPDGSAASAALECATALTFLNPGTLIAAVGGGCPTGLSRVDLATGTVTPLAVLSEAPAALAALPGGGIALGSWNGIFQWQAGGPATRLAAGLTPGPG